MQRQANHTAQDKDDYDIFQGFKDKYDNSPEESNLTSFEEDNYSDHQKRLISNIRWVKCSTIRSIDLSGSKNAIFFAINLNTKVKWNLMSDSYADIIGGDIGIVFRSFVYCTKGCLGLI